MVSRGQRGACDALSCAEVVSGLNPQVQLPPEISKFIQESTGNYGKVKLVLHRNKFWVESPFPDILRKLLKVRLWPARLCASCYHIQNNPAKIRHSPKFVVLHKAFCGTLMHFNTCALPCDS